MLSNTFAEDAQSLFNQTLQERDELKTESYNRIKNFDPNAAFDHYSSNPSETQYYNVQSGTDHLKQEGINHSNTSEVGNRVRDSIHPHPKSIIEANGNSANQPPLPNTPNFSGSINPAYAPSPDFLRGMSALSAAKEASRNYDSNSNLIFKGYAEQCRDDAGNFSDCCNQTGWGQDWRLAHCSNEEKSLGTHRAKGLTAYVGRYCARYFSWPFNKRCREHKETWCVFNSKLARIIQQQGRKGQLGVGFGEAKYPNCNGLTPAELQRLDFSRLDFHDFYVDLEEQQRTPDLNQAQQIIQQHAQEYVLAGKAHE